MAFYISLFSQTFINAQETPPVDAILTLRHQLQEIING